MTRRKPLLFFVLLIAWQAGTQAATLLLPTLGGNTNSDYPFGLFDAQLPSMRYQQVFAGTPFAAFSTAGVVITEIAFASGFVFASAQPQFQVNLSTTSRPVDGLSPVFSENVGADETVVFGPDSFYWVNPNPECNFCRFGLILPLSEPFVFEPALGNLLLDVRNFLPEPFRGPGLYARPFVAENTLGDGSSRVWAPSVGATSGTADTMGLLTLFTFTPVPEPGSGTLVGIGLLVLAVMRFQGRVCRKNNRGWPVVADGGSTNRSERPLGSP